MESDVVQIPFKTMILKNVRRFLLLLCSRYTFFQIENDCLTVLVVLILSKFLQRPLPFCFTFYEFSAPQKLFIIKLVNVLILNYYSFIFE